MSFRYGTAPLPQAPKSRLVQIVSTDSTNDVTLLLGGSGGGKLIESIAVVNTSASDKTLKLKLVQGAVTVLKGAVTIPANSGNNGTLPTVSLLNSIFSDWTARFPILGSDITIKGAVAVAMGGGESLDISIEYRDYDDAA